MNRTEMLNIKQIATANIVVASCSLADLFSGGAVQASDDSWVNGKLHLPEYQRPYRWTERELGRLVEDLQQFFGSELPDHDFYLGSIILHQTNSSDAASVQQLNIIDGQQRLTSMALLAHCLAAQGVVLPVPHMEFRAPESQNRIRANLQWLTGQKNLPKINFEHINITLVVTRSEDDAYRFFETQNTGGVRLNGPDIIKAHHLRAIERPRQNDYARLWEEMGALEPLVDIVMKARHWQILEFRELASHRQPSLVRTEVVTELAENIIDQPEDLAYRLVQFVHNASGWSQNLAAGGYAMRQPLNAGVNTIHYLQYFHSLRQKLLVETNELGLEAFHKTYKSLVVEASGSAYLQKLYDSAILLYASQFGYKRLFEASLWLFRVVYSPRLINEKTVRESSVQSFVKKTPLLDWIAFSHDHTQLMGYLRGFTYVVDSSNLSTNGKSIKTRFVDYVAKTLQMALPEEMEAKAAKYDSQLVDAILRCIESNAVTV